MLSLSLLFFALALNPTAIASNFVSGVGRSSQNENSANVNVQFSLDSYDAAVNSIVESTHMGPNRTNSVTLPVSKLYGVNIGNWLISEPWMSPIEWVNDMEGQFCANGDCSICRQSEWSLATYLGQEKTNQVFQQHWQSWLTQADVDGMKAANLNSIRVPMGFWIIEDIVDRTHEPYAQGGLDELIRGLTMFKNAGLNVILDQHAMPGVSSSGQMFVGNCTSQVEFYNSTNDYNYKRAVTWSIVMTYLAHTHPAFETVFTLEAINEPLQNAAQTPGLGRYEIAFVLGVRAIELLLGITCDDTFAATVGLFTDSIAFPAFQAAIPIIAELSLKYQIGPYENFDFNGALGLGLGFGSGGKLTYGGLSGFLHHGGRAGHCLATQFMNRDWQYRGTPANPTDAAHGPQLYDNHLYFNFGGVAPHATEDSYMVTICNTTRVAQAAAIGNAPLYTGEWSLATAFKTTSTFLKKWGDAQKMAWAQGAGWVFWNWKLEVDGQTYPILGQYLQWSYRDALAAGLFTTDPAEYFDDNVCAPYLTNTTANATTV